LAFVINFELHRFSDSLSDHLIILAQLSDIPMFIVGCVFSQRLNQVQESSMAKTTSPKSICSELGTKSRLEKNFDIDALRKPLKLTATLKRRALKKKPMEPLQTAPR
jgi:hypothetical protein